MQIIVVIMELSEFIIIKHFNDSGTYQVYIFASFDYCYNYF